MRFSFSFRRLLDISGWVSLSGLLACGPTALSLTPLNLPLTFSAPSSFAVANLQQGNAIKLHNAFAMKLLQLQSQNQTTDKNQILSPLSLSLALNMLANGADGQTYQEISQALNLPEGGLEKINQENEVLLKSLQTSDQQVLLRIANSFWLDSHRDLIDGPVDVNFTQNFQRTLEQNYLAPAQTVDFDQPTARVQINQWVRQATQDKIQQIIDEPTEQSNTIAVLLNAIYFKARWKYPFKIELTRQQDFYPISDKPLKLDTMYLNAPIKSMHHIENPQGSTQGISYMVAELPYGSAGRLAMDIFLPDGEGSLKDMVAGIASQVSDKAWFNKLELSVSGFQLYLPRFKFEQQSDLIPTLKQLKIERVFSQYDADLSRMVHAANAPEQKQGVAYITKLMQKSLVEVNEEGTEAAAVTKIETGCGPFVNCPTSAPPPPVVMRVDHPFLFLIRDQLTGAILFTGLVSRPDRSVS